MILLTISNVLLLDGENLQRVHNFMRSKFSVFDFENILPCPDDVPDEGHWKLEHWGTPYNSSSAVDIDENCFEFYTSDFPPFPVLIALSKLFPDIKFSLLWAAEDNFNLCDTDVFLNGSIVESFKPDSQAALAEHIFTCWGKILPV